LFWSISDYWLQKGRVKVVLTDDKRLKSARHCKQSRILA
jgi:hypothetical protein